MASGHPYRIELTTAAAKELARLSASDRQRVQRRIDGLAANPRPRGAEKIAGADGPDYRIGAGNYRVLYRVQDEALWMLVIRVAHRKDAYRNLGGL
jgi:mRNA interferase RelE/StbE